MGPRPEAIGQFASYRPRPRRLSRGAGTELYGVATLDDADVKAMEERAEQQLRQVAADIERAGASTVTTVLRGAIPEALADHVQTSGADLVIMTTHDKSQPERVLVGSVAESVVRARPRARIVRPR